MRKLLLALLLAMLLLSVATPALAQEEGPGKFRLFGDIYVPPGQIIYGDVATIFGNITVEGTVTGDVVAVVGNVTISGESHQSVAAIIGNVTANRVPLDLIAIVGKATVNQEVGRDVVAVVGSVNLQPNAVVRRDAVVIVGSIHRGEGAQVLGNTTLVAGSSEGFEVSGPLPTLAPLPTLPSLPTLRPLPTMPPLPTLPPFPHVDVRVGGQNTLFHFFVRLVQAGLFTLVMAALALLAGALFPKHLVVTKDTMQVNALVSFGVGLLTLIVAALLTLPLFITCIGPFLMWAAIFVASVFGLAALGLWVGEGLLHAFQTRAEPLVAIGLGTLIIVGVLAFLGAIPFIQCFSWLFWVVVESLALGAVITSRFGTMPPLARTWVPPAPPAPPALPVEPTPPTAVVSAEPLPPVEPAAPPAEPPAPSEPTAGA